MAAVLQCIIRVIVRPTISSTEAARGRCDKGSVGARSRRTQGVWGAGPPTAGGEARRFLSLEHP